MDLTIEQLLAIAREVRAINSDTPDWRLKAVLDAAKEALESMPPEVRALREHAESCPVCAAELEVGIAAIKERLDNESS